MKQGVIEMKNNAVNRPYFVVKDDNDSTLFISESFTDRIACERNIIYVRESTIIAQLSVEGDNAKPPKLVVCQHASGTFYFVLYSIKGNIILASESYSDKEVCIEQMRKFKAYCSNAKLVDLL
jgi:uncharacterized protein YegP (UPF0339 family)